MTLLLVPGDPLLPRRPDPHFAEEAAAATAFAVIDHDALAAGRDAAAAVARVSTGNDAVARVIAGNDAVYRGWMLRSEHYAAMASALQARGVTLRTSAEQYRQAHELPGWYPVMAGVTPETVWTVGAGTAEFTAACARLGSGPAVLRDYTKSEKHHWDTAAYIAEVADPDAAWQVASTLRSLRGDDFTGGFVLRRFETFTGAEARTWWIDGECRLVTAHPDTPGETPSPDTSAIAGLIPRLGLPFITADLVQHTDGRWRLVEIGDGQVSDCPSPATGLISLLSRP
ncbi:ATP-grasp domain-containing protein [Actinoplanes sp. TFC3]|uniref:ATP-grasp domain-containing protein n=1 Tax=Actinoplanes sp. TFC3 TaxID=1710355 RepID=UPI000B04640B|nr:ATP-grasp domain-containing protein [Actinoplanes sp. TFC3]